MTMNITRKTRVFGIVVLAVFTALVLLQKPLAGESSREADGARLLRGAIDMHFHVDATTPAGTGEQAAIRPLNDNMAAAWSLRYGLDLFVRISPPGSPPVSKKVTIGQNGPGP